MLIVYLLYTYMWLQFLQASLSHYKWAHILKQNTSQVAIFIQFLFASHQRFHGLYLIVWKFTMFLMKCAHGFVLWRFVWTEKGYAYNVDIFFTAASLAPSPVTFVTGKWSNPERIG